MNLCSTALVLTYERCKVVKFGIQTKVDHFLLLLLLCTATISNKIILLAFQRKILLDCMDSYKYATQYSCMRGCTMQEFMLTDTPILPQSKQYSYTDVFYNTKKLPFRSTEIEERAATSFTTDSESSIDVI